MATMLKGAGIDRPMRRLPPARAYALWAENYDRDANPLLALEERVLIPMLPDLRDALVLDLACGTGRWLKTLLARGARQGVGLDVSREMIMKARLKQGLQGALLRGDCTAIPISAAVVDFAVCSFAASYVANLHSLAAELSRVIRTGGRLILTDLHPSGLLRGWRRTFRYRGEVFEILHSRYSVAQMCSAFQEFCFKVEAVYSPCFGNEEKPIFKERGKEDAYGRLQGEPAILICCFERCDSHDSGHP